MQYYYHDGKDQKGPYSFNELISLGIKKDTKVWREGIEDWKNAGELDEFKDILKDPVVPPPFKATQETPPPFIEKPKPIVTEQASIKKETTFPVEKKSNYSSIIIAFAVIGALATAAFFYSQYSQAKGDDNNSNNFESPPAEETYQEKKMSLAEQEAAYPTSFLSVDGTYRQTLIGKKFAVEMQVSSSATVAMYKDFNIEFIFYSRTGTEIDRASYTFYEFVQPGRTTTINTKIDRPATATKLGFEIRGALVSN